MFVQVIKGHTKDAAGMRRQHERWRDEVRPSAVGFMGGTAGVADDGTVIVFARFADRASAQANSERPEQSNWWAQTAKVFDGEPSFRESSDITTTFDGGSDDAGFVQIMEGSVTDRVKAEAMETPELLEQFARRAPICSAVSASGSTTGPSWRPRTSRAKKTRAR